jgi:transcriptional regulator with XRE-family HTH domain
MKSVHSQIGNRIRQYRRRAGLSQEKLALNAGLTVSFLGDVERGVKNASLESLEKLLGAMGITVLEFFDYETEIKPFKDCTALERLSLLLQGRDSTEVEMVYSVVKQILEYGDAKASNTP